MLNSDNSWSMHDNSQGTTEQAQYLHFLFDVWWKVFFNLRRAEWELVDNKRLKGEGDTGERAWERGESWPEGLMLSHNGHRGSKAVLATSPSPPHLPPASQLTSWQPWGPWLVMAYCLAPIRAWPPFGLHTHHNPLPPPPSSTAFNQPMGDQVASPSEWHLKHGL